MSQRAPATARHHRGLAPMLAAMSALGPFSTAYGALLRRDAAGARRAA